MNALTIDPAIVTQAATAQARLTLLKLQVLAPTKMLQEALDDTIRARLGIVGDLRSFKDSPEFNKAFNKAMARLDTEGLYTGRKARR
jgi:hypothetical protein